MSRQMFQNQNHQLCVYQGENNESRAIWDGTIQQNEGSSHINKVQVGCERKIAVPSQSIHHLQQIPQHPQPNAYPPLNMHLVSGHPQLQMQMPISSYQRAPLHFHVAPATQGYMYVSSGAAPPFSQIVWNMSPQCSQPADTPPSTLNSTPNLNRMRPNLDAAQKPVISTQQSPAPNPDVVPDVGDRLVMKTLGTDSSPSLQSTPAHLVRERRKMRREKARSRTRERHHATKKSVVAAQIRAAFKSLNFPVQSPQPKSGNVHSDCNDSETQRRKTVRVRNRASVQRCRSRQRARVASLMEEQAHLSRENGALKDALEVVRNSGILSILDHDCALLKGVASCASKASADYGTTGILASTLRR